jgi:hypothetical protein
MTTRRPGRLAAAAALALALAGVAQVSPAEAGGTGRTTPPAPSAASGPTTFVVSSFNLLGASHTAANGERPSWPDGAQRMVRAVQLLDQHAIQVVGFQEMQQPQYDRFMKLDGATWGIYPGAAIGTAAMANSIAWRKADWALVEARTVAVPYFHGNMIRKPLVLLQNVHTGQQAWFLNTHNPADKQGAAQKWRDQAVDIEAATVNGLQTEMPDVPVFFTGDMNDRDKFFCRITARSSLLAANGGSNTGGVCTVPKPTQIDWVMGTPQARFTGYTANRETILGRTSDHPLVYATAELAPIPAESAIDHVVVLDVEGLRSWAIRKVGATGAPNLARMMSEGASTLNARTTVERTTRLPNVMSMLTGRVVDVADQGHGWTRNKDTGQTVREVAGKYVSSVYDLVHNLGGTTTFVSSRGQFAAVDRTWGQDGGVDKYLPDNGTDKIDDFTITKDDATAVDHLVQQLTSSPATFSFAQLSDLGRSGMHDGWMKRGYLATLARTDAQVGQVLDAIAADPTLAGSTVVMMTADHGGSGKWAAGSADATVPANFTVPFLVWGSGVAPGTDLYALNPVYADPLHAQPAYTDAAQPIRSGVVANLATQLLGFPALPGSRFDAAQDLVLQPPVTG